MLPGPGTPSGAIRVTDRLYRAIDPPGARMNTRTIRNALALASEEHSARQRAARPPRATDLSAVDMREQLFVAGNAVRPDFGFQSLGHDAVLKRAAQT